MQIFLYLVTLLFFSIIVNAQEVKVKEYNDNIIEKITIYPIIFDKTTKTARHNIEGGIGSGLKFKEEKNNKLYFYTITDRGPNLEGPTTIDGYEVIVHNNKDFNPYIGLVEVSENRYAKLIDVIKISENDKYYDGIMPDLFKDKWSFISLDQHLNLVNPSANSIDSEAIAVDQNGDFWIANEFIPEIIHTDNKGNVKQKYKPGDGLPLIYNEISYNSGFESITVTPNGKIYAVIECVLNINNETNQFAPFMRIIELDPKNGNIKEYAYPYEPNFYKKIKKIKLGDIEAIDNEHFLIVEQGKDNNNQMHNRIFIIDISEATDISAKKSLQGKELEYATLAEMKDLNIKLVDKKLFLDPRKYGWDKQKLEGLTIINNKKIALINDDDFGKNDFVITDNPDDHLKNYRYDINNNQFYYKEELLNKIDYSTKQPASEHSYIWIIDLKGPIN